MPEMSHWARSLHGTDRGGGRDRWPEGTMGGGRAPAPALLLHNGFYVVFSFPTDFSGVSRLVPYGAKLATIGAVRGSPDGNHGDNIAF